MFNLFNPKKDLERNLGKTYLPLTSMFLWENLGSIKMKLMSFTDGKKICKNWWVRYVGLTASETKKNITKHPFAHC
jgi:hypothetical protein